MPGKLVGFAYALYAAGVWSPEPIPDPVPPPPALVAPAPKVVPPPVAATLVPAGPQLAAVDPTAKTVTPAQACVLPQEVDDEDDMDSYLFQIYLKTPKKGDSSPTNDYSWKDRAGADRAGMPLDKYVIGGLDKTFKRNLYRLFKDAESEGFHPGITSAFRDNFRQGIAEGFKASYDGSWHGGSRHGGYGHGKAADVIDIEGDSERLWRWISKHGPLRGIVRIMPIKDPAHVQATNAHRHNTPATATAQKKSSTTAVAAAKTKKEGGIVDAIRDIAKPPSAQTAQKKSPRSKVASH